MATKVLQSLDEIEAEHFASDVRVFPLKHELRWDVSRADLDGLWLLHVREFEPRIRHVAMQPHRTQIDWKLPWDVGSGPLTLQRRTSQEEEVWRTVDRTVWAGISLPREEMHILSDIAGEDLSAPDVTQLVTPTVPCCDQFKALHQAILTAPMASELEVQRALRMQMIERLIECLVTGDIQPASWAFRSHAAIMRRFHLYVEEQGDRPVHVPELCQAIGVPERTLRYCCEQKLGMSPRAYLTLRRLILVRRALLHGAASVANAARQYGFWHLGRFAQAYRAQFGELPSMTIRPAANRMRIGYRRSLIAVEQLRDKNHDDDGQQRHYAGADAHHGPSDLFIEGTSASGRLNRPSG